MQLQVRILWVQRRYFFFFFYGQDQRVYGEPWGDLSGSSASDDPALSSPEGGDKELFSAGKQLGRKDVHE